MIVLLSIEIVKLQPMQDFSTILLRMTIVLLERLNLQMQGRPEPKTSLFISVDPKKCLPECQGCKGEAIPKGCQITPELIIEKSYNTVLTPPQEIQEQLQQTVTSEWVVKFK